jgi:hypothetical protein
MSYGVGRAIPVMCWAQKTGNNTVNGNTDQAVFPKNKYVCLPKDSKENSSIQVTTVARAYWTGIPGYCFYLRDVGGTALGDEYKVEIKYQRNTGTTCTAYGSIDLTGDAGEDVLDIARTSNFSMQAWHGNAAGSANYLTVFSIMVVARMP